MTCPDHAVTDGRAGDAVAHARAVLSGEETCSAHLLGRIIKRRVSYNPGGNFRFDPRTVDFFEVAVE